MNEDRADRLDQAAIFADSAAEAALQAKNLIEEQHDEDERNELQSAAAKLYGVASELEDKWDSIAWKGEDNG